MSNQRVDGETLMPRYSFRQAAEPVRYREVVLRCEAVELEDLVHAFEDFLAGCGYVLGGHLEVVESTLESSP